MTDTATAPADTDLDDLTPEQVREELARTRANLDEVLGREAEWREQQDARAELSDDELDEITAVIQSGDEDATNALLDKLDRVVHSKGLMKSLRENARQAAQIRLEQERAAAEQEHRQAILEAGAPEHIADAVSELLRDAEPTAQNVGDIMTRYNLTGMYSRNDVLFWMGEEQRRKEQNLRRSLQTEGVPEYGIPLDERQRMAAAEAGIVPGDKESVRASLAEKRSLLERERRR